MLRPNLTKYLLLFLFAGAAVCTWIGSEAQEKAGAKNGLKVTISVYSGRPDPFFYLDNEAEIDQLRSFLKNAAVDKAFEKRTVIPSILGYRGVKVENPGGIRDVPGAIAVYKGTMEVRNKEKVFFVDKDSALEHYLLKMAREKKAIDEKMYGKIKASER